MLKTEMTKHACDVWHPLTTKEADRGSPMGFAAISHDAAYAHALVQALRQAPDMYYQRKWIIERAAEIMRGFGYDTDT